jgi:hypothetical protein
VTTARTTLRLCTSVLRPSKRETRSTASSAIGCTARGKKHDGAPPSGYPCWRQATHPITVLARKSLLMATRGPRGAAAGKLASCRHAWGYEHREKPVGGFWSLQPSLQRSPVQPASRP